MRNVLFGYNADEAPLPLLNKDHFVVKGVRIDLDPSLEVKVRTYKTDRPVVAVDLGPHLVGAAAPHVNPGDTVTSALGGMYRFGRKIPKNKYHTMSRSFRRFIQRWLRKNIPPLEMDADLSVEKWLSETTYPFRRKQDLLETYSKMNFTWATATKAQKKAFIVKSFIKDEHYVDWKHARSINSRTDEAKCMFGPIMQAISNVLMKTRPEFIKYVPVHKRADYIIERLSSLGVTYKSSDYTSFEAHFDKIFMKDCEMLLFEHMLQGVPEGKRMIEYIRYAKYINPNLCMFKTFVIKITAKRMSGEMDTSLSNGFANLMFLYYSVFRHGMSEDDVRCVVEGDDALCVIFGKIPDSFYEDFGLSVKIEKHDQLETASFCGLIFDLKDRAVVTDPIDLLSTFGWTTASYLNTKPSTLLAILRCKALSFAYQYRHCPIISDLAYRYMQLTDGVCIKRVMNNPRFTDSYEFEILLQAEKYYRTNDLIPNVGINTRILVEKVYNITVSDQLKIEQKIKSINDLGPLNLPEVLKYAPKSYMDYYDRYKVLRQTRDYNGVDLLFPKRKAANLGVYA